MADKFIALSYSRLSTYQACPLKFKLAYLDKAFPDDSGNPAFVKGKNMHTQMENYVNAKVRARLIPTVTIPALDKHCGQAAPIADGLVKAYEGVWTEQQIAVDKDWKRVDWFSKAAYYRAIFDVACIDADNPTAIIVDWKSGKVREYDESEHSQLRLSAGVIMALYDHIDKVITSYVFLEHKQTIQVTFTREELPAIIDSFDEASVEVNCDEAWIAKKNKYCFFCAATSDQCENKKRSM